MKVGPPHESEEVTFVRVKADTVYSCFIQASLFDIMGFATKWLLTSSHFHTGMESLYLDTLLTPHEARADQPKFLLIWHDNINVHFTKIPVHVYSNINNVCINVLFHKLYRFPDSTAYLKAVTITKPFVTNALCVVEPISGFIYLFIFQPINFEMKHIYMLVCAVYQHRWCWSLYFWILYISPFYWGWRWRRGPCLFLILAVQTGI